MKQIKQKSFHFFYKIIPGIMLFLPLIVFGAGLVPCEPGECTLCDFFVMVANIINFLLFNILPSLAILMLVIAGFLYIVAYFTPDGGPEGINRAKSLLKAVFFGLLIAYGAWLIVTEVFQLLGVTSEFGNWDSINCSPGSSGSSY